MSLSLTSSAFGQNQPIPARYTCDGEDLAPPLAWSGVPEGSAAWALILEDPDAPRGVFTHWLLFNLPERIHALPEGVPNTKLLPGGGAQGRNDFGVIGYRGPCPPPSSTHRYRFVLYALDDPLPLQPGASRRAFLAALQGHTLGQAELVGTYHRG